MADLDFEQVVNTHYQTLYRFALSLTHSESEACDLTQQTCYLWATRGHQLRDHAKLKSWLMTTLHREFLACRRHETRFPHHEIGAVSDELPNVSIRMVEQLDSRALLERLAQVDEIFRVPLALFYMEDMSYRDIAAMLDIPTGTVMSRLARGKAQLRELLAVEPAAPDERIVPLKTASSGEE